MASLSENDRVAEWARWMRENTSPTPFTKDDLRAAVDATDEWIDANAAAYNLALPLAIRTNLTAQQKARLFLQIARRRFEVT